MKFSDKGIEATTVLLTSKEFNVFTDELKRFLENQDKANRHYQDPNTLLRGSAKAAFLEDLLNCISLVKVKAGME